LRVAIPGGVEQTRRDYSGLASELEKGGLREDIEFVVLGDGSKGQGPELRGRLRAKGLDRRFLFFDGYLSTADMASYLASSDAVLPLLHPGMPQFELFERYKVSGSFNLAFGYKKPLLLHRKLADLPTFRGLSIGYGMDTLLDTLNGLARDPTPLKALERAIASDARFDPAVQKPRQEAFIREAMGKDP
jgi:hypothetical protein